MICKKLKTCCDVTEIVYVAINHQLVIGACILSNVDAKFDANRGKIAKVTKTILYIEETNDVNG